MVLFSRLSVDPNYTSNFQLAKVSIDYFICTRLGRLSITIYEKDYPSFFIGF